MELKAITLIIIAMSIIVLIVFQKKKHSDMMSRLEGIDIDRENAILLAEKGEWELALLVQNACIVEDCHLIDDKEYAQSLIMDMKQFRKYIREAHEQKKRDNECKRLIDEGHATDDHIVALAVNGDRVTANRLYKLKYGVSDDEKIAGVLKLANDKVIKDYLTDIVLEHQSALSRKKRTLLVSDDYGNTDDSRWQEEKEYFIYNVFLPSLPEGYKGLIMTRPNLRELYPFMIDDLLSNSESHNDESLVDDLSPQEYEMYCADILEKNFWDVELTPASGDQGADIIAQRYGERIVIQCKLYSSPVGNKAVQEVVGALEYFGAERGVVVTNSTYTKAAKNLAAANSVDLLHHEQLSDL